MARRKVDYGTRDVPGDYDDRRGCCGCFAKGVRPIPAAYEPGRLGLSQDLGAAGRVKGTAPGPGCALAAAALLKSGADAPGSCEVVLRDADARRPAGGREASVVQGPVFTTGGVRWGGCITGSSALGRVGSAGSSTNRRCSAAEAFTAALRLTGLAPARSCCRSSLRCSCSGRRGWRRCPSSWASSRPGCTTSTAITPRTRYSAPRSTRPPSAPRCEQRTPVQLGRARGAALVGARPGSCSLQSERLAAGARQPRCDAARPRERQAPERAPAAAGRAGFGSPSTTGARSR